MQGTRRRTVGREETTVGAPELRRQVGEPLAVMAQAARALRRGGRRLWLARTHAGKLEAYVRNTAEPKLHLGAGHHRVDGWLDTDRDPSSGAAYMDVTTRFPFADATFCCIFSEHLIEHLPYATGLAMLRECYRVTRPGARIRTATPDLAKILGLRAAPGNGIEERYANWLADSYFGERYGPPAVFAINQAFRGWGHAFLYDEPTLRATLEAAGFVDVRRYPFGKSDERMLAGLEDHGVPDGNRDLSAFETMVLEAVRP